MFFCCVFEEGIVNKENNNNSNKFIEWLVFIILLVLTFVLMYLEIIVASTDKL